MFTLRNFQHIISKIAIDRLVSFVWNIAMIYWEISAFLKFSFRFRDIALSHSSFNTLYTLSQQNHNVNKFKKSWNNTALVLYTHDRCQFLYFALIPLYIYTEFKLSDISNPLCRRNLYSVLTKFTIAAIASGKRSLPHSRIKIPYNKNSNNKKKNVSDYICKWPLKMLIFFGREPVWVYTGRNRA